MNCSFFEHAPSKLIKDYADAYGKMTNETAKKLLDEYVTIETLGPRLRQAYLPKFREVLPEVKGGALLSDREQDPARR